MVTVLASHRQESKSDWIPIFKTTRLQSGGHALSVHSGIQENNYRKNKIKFQFISNLHHLLSMLCIRFLICMKSTEYKHMQIAQTF